MRDFDDLSTQEQIALLRKGAELRSGGPEAERVKTEYRDGFADIFEDYANRVEAGEDPFAEEKESPERRQAVAEAVIELLKRENVNTLGVLFEREGVVFKKDLN